VVRTTEIFGDPKNNKLRRRKTEFYGKISSE